MNLAGGLSSLQ